MRFTRSLIRPRGSSPSRVERSCAHVASFGGLASIWRSSESCLVVEDEMGAAKTSAANKKSRRTFLWKEIKTMVLGYGG